MSRLPMVLRRFAERRPGWPYELAAIGLIALYVNAFGVWQVLGILLGPSRANILPIGLTAILGGVVLFEAIRRTRQRKRVGRWTLVISVVLAGVAFRVADPAFPAKQAHVPEYVFMALVVHRALKFHLSGAALLVTTTAATAVLGSHDELLQGLSPGRTFGLRDIEVNAIAGLAGALAAYAFERSPRARTDRMLREGELHPTEWIAAGILFIGWVCLFLAIYEFRGAVAPIWPLSPLAAGGFAWAISRHKGAPASGCRYVVATIAVLMLSTALYPLTAHAFSLVFH